MSSDVAHYLVEAKWNRSSELQGGKLVVANRQVRRHDVLRWYFQKWKQSRPGSWGEFRSALRESFESQFEGLTLPTASTTQAKNLEFVLSTMTKIDVPLHDILLFSTVGTETKPTDVEPKRFRLVVIRAKSIGGDGFIQLFK